MRFSTALPVVFAGLAMAWDERAGDIFSLKSGVKTSGNSSGVFVDVGGGKFKLFHPYFQVVLGVGGVCDEENGSHGQNGMRIWR